MRSRPMASTILLGAAAAVVLAAPAGAATHRVGPGESIQAAIDAADEGDTIAVRPGTYHENLTITKDGITLRGSRDGDTVLMPAASPTPSPCVDPSDPASVNGVCVLGEA